MGHSAKHAEKPLTAVYEGSFPSSATIKRWVKDSTRDKAAIKVVMKK